jgi:transposase
MPAPYGVELRRRIVRAYTKREGSIRDVAKRFAVAPGTVQNYLDLLSKTGSLAPRPHGGGRKSRIHPRHLQQLQRLLHEMPDATVAELAKAFTLRCHVEVNASMTARAIQRIRRGARRNSPRARA